MGILSICVFVSVTDITQYRHCVLWCVKGKNLQVMASCHIFMLFRSLVLSTACPVLLHTLKIQFRCYIFFLFLYTGQCAAGTYSSIGSSCLLCTEDTYQDTTGQSSCKICPDLTFNNENGSMSSSACKCKYLVVKDFACILYFCTIT